MSLSDRFPAQRLIKLEQQKLQWSVIWQGRAMRAAKAHAEVLKSSPETKPNSCLEKTSHTDVRCLL
jgi:hypothetical protein